MQSTTKEDKRSFTQIMGSLLSFSLSDKLKFAIKAALSMALAYLIPLSQGWSQPGTAATTVMLIAAMGSVGDSVQKGAMRVVGTIIGAIIGLTLVGLFPQDREIYLLCASVVATLFLYLARAYKGDMTVFMLSAVTLLMMFQNGDVENAFIFGLDKTFMTIIGILIYTFIGVFLWPVNLKDTSVENAATLSTLQTELYLLRDAEKKERQELHKKLISQEQLLGTSIIAAGNTSSMEMDFSETQWYSIVHNYKKVNELLTLLAQHDKDSFSDKISSYVTNYERIDSEIVGLLEAMPLAWKEQKEIVIPAALEYEYDLSVIMELSQLDRAALSTTVTDMIKLHAQLCKLAEKLNSLISPMPTLFTLENVEKPAAFVWFDLEDMKGALLTFIIFWAATLLWIFVNPPGGFMIVLLATALSVLTTFSPLKPSLLIIIFSLSFVFATAMYIFVLPNLHYGWELGLFVFVYSFIGFYFINPMLAVFFLLGTATLGINNTMSYNFDIFLIILFMFYAFLFILLLFYYIPFSTKPEHLFLVMKKRFFKLSQILLQRSSNLSNNNGSFFGAMRAKYSKIHIMGTVKKMQLWASKVDDKYFDTVDKDLLLGFSKECETFVYLLEMMYHRDIEMINNPLIKVFRGNRDGATLADLVGAYAEGKDVDPFWRDEKQIVAKIEERLKKFLHEVKYNEYEEKDIIEFYENISLRRNVWLSLFACQKMMEEIDFKALETSRF